MCSAASRDASLFEARPPRSNSGELNPAYSQSDQPEALAVVEQISGEHIVVAKDDVDRPDRLFQTLRHPREGSQSGDMRTAKFAQGPVIVADDLKHPEQWRGSREVSGDLPMRALDQIDEARMIFGCANVFGLQGPPLDETDDQRVGIRIMHARRNAGGVRRTACGSFRRANDLVRGMSPPTRTT